MTTSEKEDRRIRRFIPLPPQPLHPLQEAYAPGAQYTLKRILGDSFHLDSNVNQLEIVIQRPLPTLQNEVTHRVVADIANRSCLYCPRTVVALIYDPLYVPSGLLSVIPGMKTSLSFLILDTSSKSETSPSLRAGNNTFDTKGESKPLSKWKSWKKSSKSSWSQNTSGPVIFLSPFLCVFC